MLATTTLALSAGKTVPNGEILLHVNLVQIAVNLDQKLKTNFRLSLNPFVVPYYIHVLAKNDNK
jgi:hypothetical protein